MSISSQVAPGQGGFRLLRFLRGLTQDEVSKLSGVDPAVISRAERGVRVSPRARAAIAAALEVPPETLFPNSAKGDGHE
jgi:transcriptional regulator with XRE-family HTH domain